VSRSPGDANWVRISKVYDVPDDASVQLVITCFATGLSGSAWFDDVSVAPSIEAPTSDRPPVSQEALHASVEIDSGSVIRHIPRTLYGTNIEWIWNGNGLWLERERRPDPEVARLTRELGISLIRYPGGHFADYYHWRDGVGPYEKRPDALHEGGKRDRSRLNLGSDETLEFAQESNAELLLTVNAVTGTAQEAADWVRHVNAKGERVQYWEIGNELYIKGGPYASVDPAAYADRYVQFAQAMRAADPKIQLLAIGGENQGRYASVGYSDWDRTMLQKAGDWIDYIAVHNSYAPVLLFGSEGKELRAIYGAMLAAPVLIGRNLNAVSKQIEDYAPARASRIGIAVTEWGPLFQFDPAGPLVDHAKTLGSALFVASTLKSFIESPRTEVANFFLLNDYSVLGWISSRNGQFPPHPDWAATARYYAFQLYTQHFGEELVQSKADGPTYDSDAIGLIDSVKEVPYLDVVSSLSSDGHELYVIGINKHFDNAIETSIALRGFKPAARGTAWTLTGTGIDANTGTTPLQVPGLHWGTQMQDQQNPRFYKGGPQEVTVSSSTVTDVGAQFKYRFPPHSVTSLVLTRAQ
jgi:alpha-N-arabinofuranosidase